MCLFCMRELLRLLLLLFHFTRCLVLLVAYIIFFFFFVHTWTRVCSCRTLGITYWDPLFFFFLNMFSKQIAQHMFYSLKPNWVCIEDWWLAVFSRTLVNCTHIGKTVYQVVFFCWFFFFKFYLKWIETIGACLNRI